jgi:hypothetical protein
MPNGDENDRKEEQSGMDNFNRRFQEWLAAGFFEKIWSKGLVRYEKKAVNYMALLQFACAVIVWRKLIRVHR